MLGPATVRELRGYEGRKNTFRGVPRAELERRTKKLLQCMTVRRAYQQSHSLGNIYHNNSIY